MKCSTVAATLALTLPALVAPTAGFGNGGHENGRHGASENGRIVWSRFTDDTFSTARIVTAEPDGSRVRLLSDPVHGTQDTYPVPSPDGNRIVFERDTPTGALIALMRADGSRERSVDTGCADPCSDDERPGWTPDGDRMTFTRVVGPFDGPNDSAHSAVLYVSDTHGKHLRRLSQSGIDGVYEDYQARWSPDRRTITFDRVRDADLHAAIFAMDADRKHVRQLTPWELDADLPDISQARSGPTKGLVVFETYGPHGPPPGVSQDIATVPTDCASVGACTARIRYLTHNGAGPTTSTSPGWAPDGRRVAFSEWTDTTFADIWTMRPDGSDRRQVSRSPLWDWRPNWAVGQSD